MNNLPPFQGWIASLSDGTTAFEQPPIPGERSSWQRFLNYVQEKGLSITGLRLQRGNVTIHALPRKLVEGYVQAYELKQSMFSGDQSISQGIGSIIGDQVFLTWVDDRGYVWQDVRPLSEMRIHSTLRDVYGEQRPDSSSGPANR